jgi:uncharacterized membrane protein
MEHLVNFWPLLGAAVITVAFILRINPMLAIIAALLTSGFAAHLSFIKILELISSGFLKTRNLTLLTLLPLAVVGLMERHGLRERAQTLITKFNQMTCAKLLISYLFLRQLTASIGLTSLGGQPQMIRPIVAPMVEAIALKQNPQLENESREKLKALAAATDNIGLFFGEDIFVAFGAVALIATFMHEHSIHVELLHIALWGIPTAIFALLIHSARIYSIQRKLLPQHSNTKMEKN